MKKIRLGIIGCGQITRASHAPALAALPKQIEVAALYDIVPARAEAIAKDSGFGAVICRSFKEFLASGIDAAIIATPNKLHYRQTIDCLNAGKHVLVEKPMATNLRQADAMCELARRKRLHLQVNQSFRYFPLYNFIAKTVADGKIGKPLHIRCLRAGVSAPNVGWSPGADWFVSRNANGGILMDIAVHMADLLYWYFGDVESISAQNSIRRPNGEVIDNSASLFRFANGATGVLELSWTFPVGGNSLEIWGEKGSITVPASMANCEIRLKGKSEPKIVPASECKFTNSHEWFVKSIHGATGNPVPGEAGRNALALLLAIVKSSERGGRPVKPETV
jgi:predicted dehydrogenase